MKWLASLLVVLVELTIGVLSATWAASSTAVVIESISHTPGPEAKEKLTFKLSAQAGPKVFAIKGDNPRLVVDFPNCTFGGKGVIPLADGKLATTIRTGIHQTPDPKTRVVVDLAKQIAVGYTREYSEADNTLVIELFPESQEAPVKEMAPVVAQEPAAPTPQPPVQTAVVKPPEDKPLSPVFPPQEPVKKASAVPAKEITPVAAETKTAQLLDISFDDSSSRGEMVLFHLTNFHPPAISAVEKDNPRVLCDFAGMELGKGVEENIAAKGKYVERISTTRHSNPDQIRVVLNLSPNRDYDLQQVFFKSDNLFVLIVNELPPDKQKK